MFYSFGKKKKTLGLPAPDVAAAEAAFGRFVRYGARNRFGFGRQYFGARYPQFGKRKGSKMPKMNPGAMVPAMPVAFGRSRFRFGQAPLINQEQIIEKPMRYIPDQMQTIKQDENQEQNIGKPMRYIPPNNNPNKLFQAAQQCLKGGGMVNCTVPLKFGARRYRRKGGAKKRKGGVKGRKPPAYLLKACRRKGIKCTRKVGKHRVYKSKAMLKRMLKKKGKSVKRKSRKGGKKRKGSKRRRRSTRRSRSRRTFFGFKI